MTRSTSTPSAIILLFALINILSLSTALAIPTINTLSNPFKAIRATTTQTTPQFTPGTSPNAPECLSYSRIANLSAVGLNATYRAAYLLASPEGSDPARAPLDTAELELPTLKFNSSLNAECGNLTTLSTMMAATNFSMGVVLQFRIKAVANGAGHVGVSVLGVVVGVLLGVGVLGDLL